MLEVLQIPVLNDNYIYLAHCSDTGDTAVIDPAVVSPVLEAAKARGWKITHILNTHHHDDHTGGNLDIQEATGCTIVGAANDAARIPGIQVKLSEGDRFKLGNSTADIIEVPGHTSGHIAYSFREDDVLFCGDTLFALGCGRVFEGTMLQMWTSLKALRSLPDSTKIYCAHEYTQSNARFAETIDPGNANLMERIVEIDKLRTQNIPTVPSTIGIEKETNPFFRADDESIATYLGLDTQDALSVFSEVRHRKDNF